MTVGLKVDRELLKHILRIFKRYNRWLLTQELAENTKRAYRSRINHFLVYVATSAQGNRDVLRKKGERDRLVGIYKTHLLIDLKLRPNSVNAALAAIDHFFEFRRMTRAGTSREKQEDGKGKVLSAIEREKFLAAVRQCRRSKDRAILLLITYATVRPAELVRIKITDLRVVGNYAVVTVHGARGKVRYLLLPNEVAEAVQQWLADREKKFRTHSAAEELFLNPKGDQMSTQSVDLIVRKVAATADLAISAGTVRRSCL